jgi:hypothetical protein
MSAVSSTFGAHQSVHLEERATPLLVEGFALAIPTKARS